VTTYVSALAALMTAVLIVVAGYAVSAVLSARRPVMQADPFLGGPKVQEHAASRFHLRWYPVTLLFLAFDMEMVVMYPWVRIVSEVGVSAVIEMFVFLFILLTGVGYAWREGALRWV
jgi:NADH-quinone oxidoreductase subunit A